MSMQLLGIYRLFRWIFLAILAMPVQPRLMAGDVLAWGHNYNGSATPPPGLSGAVQVRCGDRLLVALRSNGTLMSWGQFGGIVETLVPSDSPPIARFDLEPAAGSWPWIAAVDAEGVLRCWGTTNYNGQLNVPVDLGPVISFACGGKGGTPFGVAVTADGEARVWGTGPAVPADLPPLVEVETGAGRVLALAADGTVHHWGNNWNGTATIPPGLSGAVSIASGWWHSAAVLADGTLVMWGWNANGECDVPSDLGPVRKISLGRKHSVALLQNGCVRQWGFGCDVACLSPPDPLPCNARQVWASDNQTMVLLNDLPDGDLDGFPDNLDNCVYIYNPDQADCTNDGVGDVCELAGGQSDQNQNSIPDGCECLGDIVADAQTNGVDLAALLGQWGTAGDSTFNADIDRSGQVDGLDLAILMGFWGPCAQ